MKTILAILMAVSLAAYASRNFIAASSQYAALQSAAVTGYPATFSAWFNANSTNATGTIVVVQDSANTARFGLFSLAGGGFQVSVTATNGGAGYNAVGVGGNPSNTWIHVCAVFSSSTLRSLYVNGTFVTNDTQQAVMSPSVTFNSTHVGTRALSGALGTYVDARLADVCIWPAALAAGQITALAAGADPRTVSSTAPTFYAPFWGEASPEINLSGAAIALTNSPAKGTTDPRIYRP